MRRRAEVEAVVVGAGPNGLAAAVTLAQAGRSVLVLEAEEQVGGGARTEELTLPGFRHDVCSAVHPLAVASPFLRSLPLAEHGLEWIDAPLPLAHPLDGRPAARMARSLAATAEALGPVDGPAWEGLLGPLVGEWEALLAQLLRPLRLPRHPLLLGRFGLSGLRSAEGLAGRFRTAQGRALLAGLAAHSAVPLERLGTAAVGLVLAIAGHAVGWPVPRGGAGGVSGALASLLHSLGGGIETGRRIASLDELPAARAVLLDVTPRQLLALAGERLPTGYRRRLRRYRYGPGTCKLDLALDGPVPWRDRACRQALVVHVGGSLEEIAAAEAEVWRGDHPERPFVLVAQQSLIDSSRAPEGRHTLWAYCHVPHGSRLDVSDRIEAQIERFAPGFRERILGRRVMLSADLERHDANLVGGDINGGAQVLSQVLARPVARWDPYATPLAGVYLCSASTPPGGGVHGMCGHNAALAALRRW